MNSPFITKEYKSYDEYLEQQKSKLDDGLTEKKWFKDYNTKYPKMLKWLFKTAKLDISGLSALCIGARTGEEVEALCGLGAFTVGIDVNTGKDNKWVVTGDASNIQYPDRCVNVVYTNVLDHILDIDKCLSEIKRILKPDGLFILLIGSANDAKIDRWGSTYWDSVDSVICYLRDKYGFIKTAKIDVSVTNWFSDFIVFKNGVL